MIKISRSLALFCLLLVVNAYFLPRWADWNQNSRFDLVLAVVDKGTLTIDDYYGNTGDYALFQGHAYSDKAPGSSFLAIPVYWVFRTAVAPLVTNSVLPRLAANPAMSATLNPEGNGLLADKVYFFVALVFCTFFVVAVPSALLGVLVYRLLFALTGRETHALLLALAAALATPAFAYSNLLYGHQIAAAALFAAFYLLYRRPVHPAAFRLALAGFLLGLSLITEYPTALIAAGLGLYAIYQVRDWRKIAWLIAGGIVPLVPAAAYNLAIFGTPLPVGYEYSALWQDVHQTGFLSLTGPRLDALWGTTFGLHRGLFLLSPFLLLALPGFWRFWQEKRYRAEFLTVAWGVASFFIFNGSSAMWSGGYAVGPRYLIPMLPFLVVPIAFFLRDTRTRGVAFLTALLVFVSFLAVWAQTLGGQSLPQYQPNPLIDYSLPRLAAGDIARNAGMILGLRGWQSLAPVMLLSLGLGAGWIWRRGRMLPDRPAQLSESQT